MADNDGKYIYCLHCRAHATHYMTAEGMKCGECCPAIRPTRAAEASPVAKRPSRVRPGPDPRLPASYLRGAEGEAATY